MKKAYEIKHSNPDLNKQAAELLFKDLAASYGDEAQARMIIDPLNDEHVHDLGIKLDSQDGVSMAVVDEGDQLVGLGVYGDWRRGDQWPFSSPIGKVALLAQKLRGIPNAPFNPYGIHTLAVEHELLGERDRNQVVSILAGKAIELTGGGRRQIRISVPDDDPAVKVLRNYDFMPTGRYGERVGIPSLRQQLYIRPKTGSFGSEKDIHENQKPL